MEETQATKQVIDIDHIHQLNATALESELTLISQSANLKGDFVFDRFVRIHGRIVGNIQGLSESIIVIGETASIQGKIKCHHIIIDGFVHADIESKAKVTISESGTVIGNIISPKLEIKFGAHFEGKAST